jgi:hypothetical protein
MKTLSSENKSLATDLDDLKTQTSNTLSKLTEMNAENIRDRRLLHFCQILAKFVASEFRKPLEFPSDFFHKLGNGEDLVLRKQVHAIGVKTGVTVEQILEWEPLICDIFGIAHPDIAKSDFIAVAQELIAERRLSESSFTVFEKIFDAVNSKRTEHNIKAT